MSGRQDSSTQPRVLQRLVVILAITAATSSVIADDALLKTHCVKCHGGPEPKGDFSMHDLGAEPDRDSIDLWTASLDRVKAGEMPPAKQSQLSSEDRERLIRYLSGEVERFAQQNVRSHRVRPLLHTRGHELFAIETTRPVVRSP